VDAAAVGLAAAGIAAVPGVIATLNVRADRAAKAAAENRSTSLSEIRAINESLREDNERLREEMTECRREIASLRVEMEQMRRDRQEMQRTLDTAQRLLDIRLRKEGP
jgi:predicted nuclease with TOPRIM domain